MQETRNTESVFVDLNNDEFGDITLSTKQLNNALPYFQDLNVEQTGGTSNDD